MKLKLYTLLFIALTTLAFSCKTAKKLYERGDYTEAVELAAKKLQKDPDDPKLLDIIKNAYGYAVSDHESRIRSNAESTNELKWEYMYNEYASLQRMYDAIFRVPSVFTIINPVDYSSYLATYAEKAAQVRVERGMHFMDQGDYSSSKQSYRSAYYEFQAALKFLPGDPTIASRSNEAYDYAVTNVIILPMQQQGGYVYSSYTVGGNNLDDQLIRNLQYNSGNNFVKYYSAWEARSKNIRVDQEVDMQLVSVDIGRYHDTRSSRKVSRDIVIKETVIKPDSIVKEYAKVNATITTTSRTMSSSALLQIYVRDVSDERGRWLWSDNITGNHNWITEFSTYTGDIRALSDAEKQQVERRREFEPTESEIMRILIDQVSNNTLYRIKSYFDRI